MLFDVDDDIEVAASPSANPRLAVAGRAQTRPVRDAGRDFQFDAAGVFGTPFSGAGAARLLNDLAHATATRTGLRDLEKSAGADDLAASAARRAIDGARPRLGAFAAAFRAGIEFANFDLLVDAESRFFERDLHVVAQIGAALAPFAISRGGAAEKRFENSPAPAAKDFAENIERIMETAAAPAHALRKGRMTEAIVSRALIGIDQDVVGFAELFEFFFGVRVVGVFVGVIFDGEFAVGALHFLLRRGARDGQHFVVIALFRCHLISRSRARAGARLRKEFISPARSRPRHLRAAAAGPSSDNRDASGG